MAIYDKPVREMIPQMAAELLKRPGQHFSKSDAVNWFAQNYPKIKQGTITAHLIRFSTNAPSRLHYSARPGEDLLFQVDGSHFRLYDELRDPAPIHARANDEADNAQVEDELSEHASQFAYEHDLRDFLAKNLSTIEPGLQLYQEEDVSGVEFPVGGRFIDILALDRDGGYVVVELKVSKGYDRVVGQLLRYMAWIRSNHAEPDQRVRGVIVAREISQDLRLACSLVDDVSLFEYRLSVLVRPVDKSLA